MTRIGEEPSSHFEDLAPRQTNFTEGLQRIADAVWLIVSGAPVHQWIELDAAFRQA